MVHLIFRSPIDLAVIARIGNGDDVVFHEAAVWNAMTGHTLNAYFKQLMEKTCRLYVLQDDLEVTGIAQAKLLAGVLVIEYSGLVELTVKNKVIKTWR